MNTAVSLIKKAVETISSRGSVRCEVPFRGLGKPKILILTDRMDATYYASFHYPFRSLQASALVDFAAISSAGVRKALSRWRSVQQVADRLLDPEPPQAVVFSRYATPSGEDLLNAFRSRGIPVFYYCDDDLLHVPAGLGMNVLAAHADGEVVEQRRRCLAAADRLLASTPCLAETLTADFPGQRTEVLLYPPYLAGLVGPPARRQAGAERPLTIGYMGSKGHQRDLEIAVPAISELLDRFPEARFETFGTIAMPSALQRFGPRVAARLPMNSYLEFLQALNSLQWDVGLAPLIDDSFNRCRSPIKFLEYTACDIPTVASNLSVYRSAIGAGCGVLVGEQEWKGAMESLMTDGRLRRSCIDRARDACERRFGLQKVAARLLASLEINHHHEGTGC